MLLIESNRIERVSNLTEFIIAKREITVQEAAERFEVTPRTIQRDLAEMSRCLAIHDEDGKWYYNGPIQITISPY